MRTVILLLCSIIPASLPAQVRNAFSGDVDRFKTELTVFMGQNLRPEHIETLDAFVSEWDSTAYSLEEKAMIINVANQMTSKAMRPVPHFIDFFNTLNTLASYGGGEKFIYGWISGLYEVLSLQKYTNDVLLSYIRNFGHIIGENILYQSSSVRWRVSPGAISFIRDTLYSVSITGATLTCISQRDSTVIYNASGQYFPINQAFKGTRGTVLWDKAGFAPEDVETRLNSFMLNLARNNYTADSAMLMHKTYFPELVYGSFSDRATSFSSPERANFPQFMTYEKTFRINSLYEDVHYEGGLSFEGASVKGTGEKQLPARITLYRNDTLYLKIMSNEFLFTKTGLNSAEVEMTLFLDRDSIYHTNLGFSYFAGNRQVNLFRNSNPVSKSPYFNSFHKIDMYFEYLTWDMDESRITLSRARGASLGEAMFESVSYFDNDDFYNMMGFDDYHPLNRLLKFAEWYYSETFPVPEFAKWLNKADEIVMGMCMELANKGFLFYDRANNEVTIKQKTKDYLDSFAKKTDYDVIRIVSSTRTPVDNAILDLRNYNLTVNGVRGVMVSDSQKVAMYPYNQQLVIERNRGISFDGVVEAGLFTAYGKQFSFNYDTFKIRLQKVDSIKIAVETDQRNRDGNPIIKPINNMIQLGTAEIFIDRPENKSGLKSYKEYPIFNSVSPSYIFYDKIPGLEGIYAQESFYFKIDPFTYENIDHYSSEDINLAGEFTGGSVLKPTRQTLTIQADNSLGFNMIIPEEGIGVYDDKARMFNQIQMSNRGLTGGGALKRLTSTTEADEFKFFPDSMITEAKTFNMEKDPAGLFPALNSTDVSVKWLTQTDEWIASNKAGKTFDMFENGTVLDGTINLTPAKLMAFGAIDLSDSRITSDRFNFSSNAIKADTSVYNLKSRSTNGYSFIAEDVNSDINFETQLANFRLNTDSSMVKFPEIQYICTMTDFTYNMQSRILNMEQKGKSNTPLMSAEDLVKQPFSSLDKPTFFSTNNMNDTIAFSSWKGSYNLDNELVKAENINYIHIADALIQPDSGKITLSRRARIETLHNATIAVNNRHILHSAVVNIETSKRYGGSAEYGYMDEEENVQQIKFSEITVDTMTTTARGVIPGNQNFTLSPAFTFAGDVMLSARNDFLTFTGAAGIVQNCIGLASLDVKFKSAIDPQRVLIPIAETARNSNDELVISGSYLNADSSYYYPAFLSAQRLWSDSPLVDANGYLYFEKEKGRYLIGSLDKLSDPTKNGNLVTFDKNFCIMLGEGKLNFGAKYDLFNLSGAGGYIHSFDSSSVNMELILAADFHFSDAALKMMSDELRMIPTLSPVSLNTDLYTKAMKDLIGVSAADQLNQDMGLFGATRSLPKEFTYKLLLNDVKMYWNAPTSSFRSKGKIGIGFIGIQPLNVYVDGYVEIQRRRSGDMFDVYLKASDNTWYYFSYFRGVLMTQSSNTSYNALISGLKVNARKHPDASVRVPYTYMIAAEGRLTNFLRRMLSDSPAEE
ncbi:MAG: hypothetical protein LBV26_04305 [Bacteroidales bacterium]|nr:hypothetical protein [Bacteroidales bacterium]